MVNFPASLDSLSNPTATTKRDDPGFQLHTVISTLNDIVEQLEAKVGITDSPAHDSPLINTVLASLANGKTGYRQVVSADITDGTIVAADMAAGATMKQLAKTTLGSDQASITLSGLSGAYSSLLIHVQARSSTSATSENVLLRTGNGSADAGANYDQQIQYGTGTTAAAAETFGGTSAVIGSIPAATGTANRAGIIEIRIPNYAGTTWDKEISSTFANHFNTSTGGGVAGTIAVQWRSTAAIDLIYLQPVTNNFKTGTVVTIWGLP